MMEMMVINGDGEAMTSGTRLQRAISGRADRILRPRSYTVHLGSTQSRRHAGSYRLATFRIQRPPP